MPVITSAPQSFLARLAPKSQANPESEQLFEVVTPQGERIASATANGDINSLVDDLNATVRRWTERDVSDADIRRTERDERNLNAAEQRWVERNPDALGTERANPTPDDLSAARAGNVAG